RWCRRWLYSTALISRADLGPNAILVFGSGKQRSATAPSKCWGDRLRDNRSLPANAPSLAQTVTQERSNIEEPVIRLRRGGASLDPQRRVEHIHDEGHPLCD